MIRVQVIYHRDGDRLAIVTIPWWTDIYNWICNRICPCCGLSGFIFRHVGRLSEKPNELQFWLWNKLLEVAYSKEKSLFEVNIKSGCSASRALFGEDHHCFREECSHGGPEKEETVSEST